MQPFEIHLNQRPITFPRTEPGVWTNQETGVAVRGSHGDYFVTKPAPTSIGFLPVARHDTLADARNAAKIYVYDVARPAIARDWSEAWSEYATAIVEQAAAAARQARDEGALAGAPDDGAENVERWLSAARNSLASGAPHRARAFAHEVLSLVESLRKAHRIRTAGPDSECGAAFNSPSDPHSWSEICRRPPGHPQVYTDGIGHATVRYPPGTPEYAKYASNLRAALNEWRQVDEDPPPGRADNAWAEPPQGYGHKPSILPTADGRGTYNAAAQEYYNAAYLLTGDRASALARLHDEAMRSVPVGDPYPGEQCGRHTGVASNRCLLPRGHEYVGVLDHDSEPEQYVLRLGDLSQHTSRVEHVRRRLGVVGPEYARRVLMAELGVTGHGADLLLNAESLADLA